MSTAHRRLVAIAAAVPFLAASVLGTALAANATSPVDGDHKVGYCHATHSAKNPFVYIVTDKIAVIRAHEKHQDDEDVIPAFSYDDHGTVATFDGQGDPSFVENGCTGGGGGLG
ncbi:hypothetical protein ACGGZK_05550 [Agromyces sp. MMS24-K17]|uniref:hypothetical protein n=1 Tax=Agromyces sp. MMS24-K17 TaxID=3372850 RepID=UPI003754A2EE